MTSAFTFALVFLPVLVVGLPIRRRRRRRRCDDMSVPREPRGQAPAKPNPDSRNRMLAALRRAANESMMLVIGASF
uniref:Putative secreted protein n=1 Tax=Anopheles darlingi TaxID=43151 RepID=A0A2M4D2J4_ANODA